MDKVLIVGATGLLGRALSEALKGQANLITASRNGSMETVDMGDALSVEAMFRRIGPVHHILSVAGEAPFKPFDQITSADWAHGTGSKMMGQINLTQLGWQNILPGGSITLTSGILSTYPMAGSSVITTINSAVEGFVRAASFELSGKVRVNAVSPGWISETLQAMGMNTDAGLPVAEVAKVYVEVLKSDETGQIKIAAKH